MGEMKCLWKLSDVRLQFNDLKEGKLNETELIDGLYKIGVDMARKAKSEHTYKNIKGELESSIGVVIVRNRREIVRWSVLSKSGSDPAKGLADMQACLQTSILGKAELPDGTQIPESGYAAIVFAAAPYSAAVEYYRGKKVLLSFSPSDAYVFSVLKSVIK
jgi:hypothetical protein